MPCAPANPYLVSYNENFHPTSTLAPQWRIFFFAKNYVVTLSTTCNVMYISATRLVNLGLSNVFIQLLCMQVHTPYVQARCDILFQIRYLQF